MYLVMTFKIRKIYTKRVSGSKDQAKYINLPLTVAIQPSQYKSEK